MQLISQSRAEPSPGNTRYSAFRILERIDHAVRGLNRYADGKSVT